MTNQITTTTDTPEVIEHPFMTIDEVAELLKMPKRTLYQWRHRGLGPPAVIIGRRLVYRRSAVYAWIDEVFEAGGMASLRSSDRKSSDRPLSSKGKST